MKRLIFISVGIMAFLAVFAGCGVHEPLPKLNYKAATQMGKPVEPVTAAVSLEVGRAVGHTLTSYAIMPGGYMMPVRTGPSPVGAFNEDDQAAFVENLVRVLAENGYIVVANEGESPRAVLAVKFLKTEHYPEMQDYVLDVLVKASFDGRDYSQVHHVTTIDDVNLVARMFQNGLEGRKRAAELLLASVVSDLEQWFIEDTENNTASESIRMPLPFELGAVSIVNLLHKRYARPASFWQDSISVIPTRPSEDVVVVELRRSVGSAVPPFCLVTIYQDGEGCRIEIRERDRLLVTKAGVHEVISDFVKEVENMDLSDSVKAW